jgi:hypothetical protein
VTDSSPQEGADQYDRPKDREIMRSAVRVLDACAHQMDTELRAAHYPGQDVPETDVELLWKVSVREALGGGAGGNLACLVGPATAKALARLIGREAEHCAIPHQCSAYEDALGVARSLTGHEALAGAGTREGGE